MEQKRSHYLLQTRFAILNNELMEKLHKLVFCLQIYAQNGWKVSTMVASLTVSVIYHQDDETTHCFL